MSPIDNRIEQSDSPATLARAVCKDSYEERPRHRAHKSKTAGNIVIPRGPVTLPVCRGCRGEGCPDCDCGFVVDDETEDSDCQFAPGSEEKIAVLSARYHAGKEMWLTGDRTEQFAVAVVDWAFDEDDD